MSGEAQRAVTARAEQLIRSDHRVPHLPLAPTSLRDLDLFHSFSSQRSSWLTSIRSAFPPPPLLWLDCVRFSHAGCEMRSGS
jgi:hypothetical protein